MDLELVYHFNIFLHLPFSQNLLIHYAFVGLQADQSGWYLSWCAHCLLAHLALVHVPGALVEVAVGSEGGDDTQHGTCTYFRMRESQAGGTSCASIWTPSKQEPFADPSLH